MKPQRMIPIVALVACVIKTVTGCSCMGTFEHRVRSADFAAIARVMSEEIPTSKGNYYEIDSICVLKTSYGTDIERVYMTTHETHPGARLSCDGAYLQKDKVYLIIGQLYDTDNPDADSISYDGCGGFATQWDTMNLEMKEDMKTLLPFQACPNEYI